ncbi:hypothetical protein G6M70_21945 [Agrobacterium tumefaciens]|uniref:c-type cytochrome n=1 Tax=Agrobacterium tumefaciens TaxID=358 RepID=UPI001573109D|nr:hypothetical protein [Agrobacterium tumefaciens]NSZ03302.1 hypothetical protein [Agrobacterium tumefaciens]NSZ38518.1 hypothetical protein [Agrobacterium tumefaciens]NTB24444.1 hypothetical protein [Agrobacterium tumefaciens]NTB28876.1 hypothetical protein [Agrobacterium tumefaciens]NTB35771.1 hypothetical protein [Agrobacterium tumefaciens]
MADLDMPIDHLVKRRRLCPDQLRIAAHGNAHANSLALRKARHARRRNVPNQHGDSARNILACLNCHEKDDSNAAIPRLSGQPSAYLVNQLRLFSQKRRGGSPPTTDHDPGRRTFE